MAYSERIKDFSRIRSYMRQFYVYGFRSRDEYDAKSARSYDNEKRRVESWLGDFMSFRQDTNGKAVFLSVDSRHIPGNPLYKAWKASGFTKNDISLHFLLLDILSGETGLTIPCILDRIDTDYLPLFSNADPIDESTLRKKLKEYGALGLVTAQKQGKQHVYCLPENKIHIVSWLEAVAFFTEDNPLGVIGSYLADQYDSLPEYLSFKHRYILFALDSGIMLDLLAAINAHRKVELEISGGKSSETHRATTLPLKVFTSVQGGRQYIAGYNIRRRRISFYRLDQILKVRQLETVREYDAYQACLQDERPHLWGVSTGRGSIEHIEMRLYVELRDSHIAHRLER